MNSSLQNIVRSLSVFFVAFFYYFFLRPPSTCGGGTVQRRTLHTNKEHQFFGFRKHDAYSSLSLAMGRFDDEQTQYVECSMDFVYGGHRWGSEKVDDVTVAPGRMRDTPMDGKIVKKGLLSVFGPCHNALHTPQPTGLGALPMCVWPNTHRPMSALCEWHMQFRLMPRHSKSNLSSLISHPAIQK